jgi:hypothetical protein
VESPAPDFAQTVELARRTWPPPILSAPVIREKSQFRAQHDSLSLSPTHDSTSLYLHFRALGRPFFWAAHFSPSVHAGANEPARRSARLTVQRHGCRPPTSARSILDATAIVLTYVLVSMGVIIAFLLAAFVIGWFIGRLRQRRREQSGEE